MDFIDEDGIENVTSERTGIKIIPLFESATTFINGSIVDNEVAPASPDCPTLAPRRTPAPCSVAFPIFNLVRKCSGILIFLIFIDGFCGF